MSVLLEICIDSIESAVAAKQGGADRLEVCSALAVGGLTPSLGLVQQCVAETQLPVMMMIRPHEGGFYYQDKVIETMIRDIAIARSLGIEGIVLGALTKDGEIHQQHCQRLKQAAGSIKVTFHRAFDLVANPISSLDQIIELGFDRLLTSGQAATAADGTKLIRQLQERANGQITIMAGAGINPKNAKPIVAGTGVCELHASASVPGKVSDHLPAQQWLVLGACRSSTDSETVRAIKESLFGTESDR